MKYFLRTGMLVLIALCLPRHPAVSAQEAATPAQAPRLELPRDQASWTGEIPPGKALEVKSILGPIRVEPAAGSVATVEIRRIVPPGVPDEPVIHVVTTEKGVTICPVYPSKDSNKPNECVPGRRKGRMKSELWEKGVTFEYVVHVPAGVSFAGETAIGTITGTLLENDVDVETSTSEIRIVTGRSTKAKNYKGPVTVQLAASSVDRRIQVQAFNGTATVLVPARTRYFYSLDAPNGRIRANDRPKVEVNAMSRMEASNTGGPRSGPKATITVETYDGDSVIHVAPN